MTSAVRFHSRQRGFTILELVIVVLLMGLLGGVGAQMMSDTMRASMATTNNQSSGSQARYAMERMTREIHEMAFAASGYDMSTMTATSLAFNKEDGTAITFTASGTTLTMTQSGTSATLTNQLSSGTFAFAYLDQLGGVTADKEDVRFVQISLTVANTVTGQTDTLRNRVFLRNAQASP